LLNHSPQHCWISAINEFAGHFDDSGHPDPDLVVAAGFVGTKEQ
jgi:hypothetical protein